MFYGPSTSSHANSGCNVLTGPRWPWQNSFVLGLVYPSVWSRTSTRRWPCSGVSSPSGIDGNSPCIVSHTQCFHTTRVEGFRHDENDHHQVVGSAAAYY